MCWSFEVSVGVLAIEACCLFWLLRHRWGCTIVKMYWPIACTVMVVEAGEAAIWAMSDTLPKVDQLPYGNDVVQFCRRTYPDEAAHKLARFVIHCAVASQPVIAPWMCLKHTSSNRLRWWYRLMFGFSTVMFSLEQGQAVLDANCSLHSLICRSQVFKSVTSCSRCVP